MAEAGDAFVEIVRRGMSHKYLGKTLPGDLTQRGQVNLSHRLVCGWLKFSNLSHTLLNKKLAVGRRLKLFDVSVSTTVLYSLSTTPLTISQLERLDAVQRKMLRKIVGWIRHDEEEWKTTGHRMKERLESALRKQRVRPWSERVSEQKSKLVRKMHDMASPSICRQAFAWEPRNTHNFFGDGTVPSRSVGRPRQRCF